MNHYIFFQLKLYTKNYTYITSDFGNKFIDTTLFNDVHFLISLNYIKHVQIYSGN